MKTPYDSCWVPVLPSFSAYKPCLGGFIWGFFREPPFLISTLFRECFPLSSFILNRDTRVHFLLYFKYSVLPIKFWSHLLSPFEWSPQLSKCQVRLKSSVGYRILLFLMSLFVCKAFMQDWVVNGSLSRAWWETSSASLQKCCSLHHMFQ